MPKISRRKQSKPQHICGDDSDDTANKDLNNGQVGKDTVEDNNANIVVTEGNISKSNGQKDENEDDSNNDILPLYLEAEDHDDDCNLKIDESDDRNNIDTDSNYSYDFTQDTSYDNETTDFQTPQQNNRVCDFCGAVKKSPSDLARHLLKHTGEHPFQCDHCEKAFKSKRSLQHHQHQVHGISLAVSMVSIDASIPANRKRKSDESSVGCNSSPENENKKIKSEIEDMHSYPSMIYSGEPQGSMFLSEMCSSNNSFKVSPAPMKPSQEDNNNRTCQVCGKVCSKPSDLKRHMMSHTGERPFKCDICGKAFRAKNSMYYHQKSSHGLNIELSPGLQERFMKLKKQNRTSILHNPNPTIIGYNNDDSKEDPNMASSLLLQKLGQKVRNANNAVLYSYDINTHQEGEVELDENTGLFKQSGSIFNKPLVTAERIKPEPLKLTNSMVGMQIVQESHKVKRHICVKNETVLVTRLDGVDVLTAKDISLYKCYLCGKLFDDLLKIQCHLSMHFQRELTLYRCQICDDTFWFKFRVINHIRKNHPNEARLAEKRNDANLKETEKSTCRSEACKMDSDEKEKEDPHKKNWLEDEKSKADELENEKDSDEKQENGGNSKQGNGNADDESIVKENEDDATSKENPVDKKPTSEIDRTKDNVIVLHDLSNKGRKTDPFINLYKGIRFRKKPNGSFICLLCRKSFYKEFALLQHIKIHNQQDICYCEECGEGFMEYGKLRIHFAAKHKKNDKTVSPSATAKNTLLSSLLSKTSQWHKPAVNTCQLSTEKYIEKAKEILEKEGIQEDVTVVMPSEPDEENWTESRKANLDTILSKQESESFADSSNPTEESEIHLSPKRLLMSKLLSRSKRKSSQPVKLENPEPVDAHTETQRSDTEKQEIKIKQEPVEELKEAPPPALVSPPEAVPMAAFPVINSELMAAKLNNLALLHPGIHPVVMANTLATLAAQGLPVNTQGMLLPDGKFFPAIPAGFPVAGLPVQTVNGMLGAPVVQPPSVSVSTGNIPVTVQIPTPAEKEEQLPEVKQEPTSPVDNNNTNSNQSSDDLSLDVSGSESGSADKEKLVGYPRVRWNGSEAEQKIYEGNPSNLPSCLQKNWTFSSDGRKVTSLSRTHSRLPIVSTPVDRETVCKPTVLPDGRTVFRCPFCSKDFLSYSDINRHMDFHEDIRPFKCKYCEYFARTNSQLKVHMMRHQGIREFCCKLCNYKGVTQSDLNRHMKSQIHLLKAKHACPYCEEGFVTTRNLNRHMDGNCIVKMQKLENGEKV